MTPQELQQLENNPSLRIKFASIDDKGMFVSDAHDDYQDFFKDLLNEVSDWTLEPQVVQVQTRHQQQRPAHVLSDGKTRLAMVEHETGMEIVVAIAAGVASDAITSLVAWGWNKWKQIRAAKAAPGQVRKVEPTLTLEGIVARDAAGRALELIRVERPGPLSAEAISAVVADFIDRLGPTASLQADDHERKLGLTYAWFLVAAVIGLGPIVASIALDWRPPNEPPWPLKALVAALGGWLGGLARSAYFFSFDAYAFNHRLRTGESSKWAKSICKDTLDDKLDPLWVWHIWCLKPLVGATAGMIFALAIEFGLISLGAKDTSVDGNFRMLVLGGLSGFFSDGMFQRLRTEIDRRAPPPAA
jgi:hypothetical protein